ncbi:MAG TPA: HAMP domain-containing protein [Streptosporangiaceae bacterium]|nr:HAMP domain-containing protein [Streptosporangiaceae bacterium]
MLDRLRRWAWGLPGRLIASYILVTLTVVVLVEALLLGFQVPSLVTGAQLQAQVDATARSYAQQLSHRVPAGTVLGEIGQPAWPGQARPAPDGTLVVPAIAGPIHSRLPVTAVVAVSANGTVVASSAPSRYPPGRAASSELPDPAAQAIESGIRSIKGSTTMATPHPTPYGGVLYRVLRVGRGGTGKPPGLVAYVYVQVPWSPGFINPVRAWRELGQLGETGPLLQTAPFALLIAIVPVGVLFGLLASRRLVRRLRRLERAAAAVADGDYTVTLPISGRDEVGQLEANFTSMTRQLGSALAAERERATGDARAAERARIAREVHDAISQHLFALRMIAAGLRRADPGNQQVQAIERVSEEAMRDVQALLIELRPPSLNGAGLAPALQEICAAYHDRLGVTVEASVDDIAVPPPVEHALLRITQEACSNAVRHGNARRLDVSMTTTDGHVQLSVRDTGTGFDPAAPRAGSGLAHIRDRVAELGGTVDIDSAPGRGAALTVRVPVP